MHCIDHFPLEMRAANLKNKYFVVLLVDITVETTEDNMAKTFKRGFYSFSSLKKQLAFTTGCNCDTTEDIAYRFTLTKE